MPEMDPFVPVSAQQGAYEIQIRRGLKTLINEKSFARQVYFSNAIIHQIMNQPV